MKFNLDNSIWDYNIRWGLLNKSFVIEIYLILREGYYKPKEIIEYNRIAYKGKTTTRITFDMDIKSSRDVNSFFKENINYFEVTNKKDVVLEVKFDRFLEPYIANILDKYIVRNQSVSKYIMGRNVDELL